MKNPDILLTFPEELKEMKEMMKISYIKTKEEPFYNKFLNKRSKRSKRSKKK